MLKAYLHFIFRYRWLLAVFFFALFISSVVTARHLQLKSDLKELLPEKFQSVRDLNKIVERVGGTGSLIVAIECDDPEASIRFGEDLVANLKQYPSSLIKRVEYNGQEAKNFVLEHKYLYADLADIQEIYHRLEKRIEREKLKRTGVFLDLETSEEAGNEENFEDIKAKYRSKTSQYEHYIRGYFFDESQKLMAIMIRPPGSAIGIDFSKKLVSSVQANIDALDPSRYHPSMKVNLTGHYRRVLFEYQTLKEDIVSTAGLCVLLVGIVVFIYYRRVRMVALMAWATFHGTLWTFAIVTWSIGYLTAQTAFLGSIIIGNGINYGLILMARYLEERRLGKNPEDALSISVSATLTGTLASSATTSVSFAVLMMSDIRGFVQFGFIGGLGMLLCWVATYTVLPVYLILSEQILPVVRQNASTKKGKFRFSFAEALAAQLPRWSNPLAITGFFLALLSIPLMLRFLPNSLEYDFNKLSVKTKGKLISENAKLNERVKKIFGGSVTPAVVVTDHAGEAEPLCQEIMRKNELDPPEKRVIERCVTIQSYVPRDQEQKRLWLGKIRDLIDRNTFDSLKEEDKKTIQQFKEELKSEPVKLADLPEAIVANFTEKNGDVGKLAYVISSDKVPLWDGKNLIRFSDIIRKNKLPSGAVVTSSGDSAIFADIIRAVAHDGPIATALSFVAVCIVVVLLFREKRGAFFILGTLVWGVILMGGVIALFDIKINFFNFIAIPTTFGIGVDYGCNIYQRYRLEGKGSMSRVIRTTGGAVLLCSVTTIIGYFTLVIAKNQALASFGWIGIIGELTCILSAIAFVPALVIHLEKKGET